jgi:hypothetical protein
VGAGEQSCERKKVGLQASENERMSKGVRAEGTVGCVSTLFSFFLGYVLLFALHGSSTSQKHPWRTHNNKKVVQGDIGDMT